MLKDDVNNPDHYGGKDNPYEAIKIIEALGFGFHIGNVFKYISRAGKKLDGMSSDQKRAELKDLKKAKWYLDKYIHNLESEIAESELIISYDKVK